MREDDAIDALLKSTMAEPPPLPSTSFNTDVVRRIEARRLPGSSRIVLAAYTVAAVGVTVWFMRDWPAMLIGAALAGTAILAVASGLYVSRLARAD